MVWVPQQLVGAALASTVTIECLLEAHPAALHYWTRPDGQVSAFRLIFALGWVATPIPLSGRGVTTQKGPKASAGLDATGPV